MSKVTLNPNDVLRTVAQQLGLKPFTFVDPHGTRYEMYATHVEAPAPPSNGLSRAEQLRRARISRKVNAYWTPERRAEHGRKVAQAWENRKR